MSYYDFFTHNLSLNNPIFMKEDMNSFLQYPVMSTLSPSYPRGPWHYKDVHLLAVTYQSTAEAVRAVVPRPLQPAEGNRATIYWWRFTEVTGFEPYSEVAHSVACTFEGKPVTYIFQAFLDSESPTIAGREILGFPKKHGEPELKTVREVLTGTLGYGGVQVAVATMQYRAVDLSDRLAEIEQDMLQTPQLVLKLFPDVDNHTPKVAQLVRVNQYDVRVKGAWGGAAELSLVPHVGCPVAALPVVRVLEGLQLLWDVTLRDGQVVYDYLEAERLSDRRQQ
jgi:acetoacetate decarboxylase